jgi:hypothetical protein
MSRTLGRDVETIGGVQRLVHHIAYRLHARAEPESQPEYIVPKVTGLLHRVKVGDNAIERFAPFISRPSIFE